MNSFMSLDTKPIDEKMLESHSESRIEIIVKDLKNAIKGSDECIESQIDGLKKILNESFNQYKVENEKRKKEELKRESIKREREIKEKMKEKDKIIKMQEDHNRHLQSIIDSMDDDGFCNIF